MMTSNNRYFYHVPFENREEGGGTKQAYPSKPKRNDIIKRMENRLPRIFYERFYPRSRACKTENLRSVSGVSAIFSRATRYTGYVAALINVNKSMS